MDFLIEICFSTIEAWEVGLLPKTFSLLLRRDRMFSTRSISSFLWVKKPYFLQIFSTLCSVVRQTYVIEPWLISILDSSYPDNLCLGLWNNNSKSYQFMCLQASDFKGMKNSWCDSKSIMRMMSSSDSEPWPQF